MKIPPNQLSIPQFINKILMKALEVNASDIHFEPTAKMLNIRYRKDGTFYNFPTLPITLAKKVLAHIKALANLDVAETQKPQDGRMPFGKSSFRIATIPVQFGESLVLRVLNANALNLKLETLGIPPPLIQKLRNLTKLPHGLIIVAGPTGAGKTTTLYTLLQDIYSDKKKYLTAEDPIEYALPGITQVAINNAIGLTFSKVLRSFLRHDPDIILVGEIRDLETAKIAFQASLTGHLVLTTLHTNNAATAIIRLIDLGLPPSIIASSLQAILAQQLIPTQTGRTATFELLQVTPPLRQLISNNPSIQTLETQACLDGMIKMNTITNPQRSHPNIRITNSIPYSNSAHTVPPPGGP